MACRRLGRSRPSQTAPTVVQNRPPVLEARRREDDLTDNFRKLYGVSLSEYHRRAKIGWAVGELVASNVCVESVALRAGYRSPGSFHEAFRSATGSTPAEVRRLSRDARRDVLDGPLSLRIRAGIQRSGRNELPDRIG